MVFEEMFYHKMWNEGIHVSGYITFIKEKGLFFFKQKTAYEISACLVGSEMCIRDSQYLWQLIQVEKIELSQNLILI